MEDLAAWAQQMGATIDLLSLKYIGMHGVHIFFGLSGFLITSKLIADEQKHGRISLWGFYIRRTFRILPATLFFLFAVGALALAGVLDVTLGRWLSSLLFSANYSTADYSWYLGHFWSLAVEEHFYLIWPAVFLWLGVLRRRLGWAIAAAMTVAVWRVIDFKFQITGATPAMFLGRTDIQVDHIIWGVIIALAYADPAYRPSLQRVLSNPSVGVLLLLALAGMLLIPDVDWKLKFALYTVHGLVVPLAILSTYLNTRGRVSQFLELPLMRLIGRLSFSLYLWQQLFFVWQAHRVPELAVLQVFPGNVVAVLVCAMISFWLIEEPFIALGRKILKRWPAWKRSSGPELPVVQSPNKA
jgi:peptidoglycan/LPS O-acetylase OafA/YrhL